MGSDDKNSGGNGEWGQWANHVLAELKRLNDNIGDLRNDVTVLTVDVAQLKVKSGLWGAAAAICTIVVFLGMNYLKQSFDEKNTAPPSAIERASEVDSENKDGADIFILDGENIKTADAGALNDDAEGKQADFNVEYKHAQSGPHGP
jgi:hypothetical protein